MKAKIIKLETNSNNNNIRELYRGINYFKMRYQPRNNMVENEKGDLLADSHTIWIDEGIISLSYWMYMELRCLAC